MSKEWPLWEVFIRSQHGLAHKHVGSSNTGTGAVSTPSLSAALDIYGGAALGLTQSQIESAMPVRIAFDDAANGAQGYRVLNEKGDEIGTGTIVPGQGNKVTINVPVTNADGTTTQIAFDTTISGSPVKGDSFDIKFNKDARRGRQRSQKHRKETPHRTPQ